MRGDPGGAEHVVAAGAVVRRFVRGEPVILAVHRPRYDDWSLPKGKVHRGETLAETAIREVREETGVAIRLGPRLPTVAYDSSGVTKHVYYWLADLPEPGRSVADMAAYAVNEAAGGFEPNDEVDAVAWLGADAALTRLTYADDRATVAAALTLPPTTAVIVVRHATAVDRTEWTDPDDERPLLPAGEREAQRLVAILAPWGPRRVLTSPATRCQDTIAPYAATHGIAVELVAELAEDVAAVSPAATADMLATVAQDVVHAGTPTLICTHRPVLGLVAAALGVDADDAERLQADTHEPLPPAGFWALHRGLDGVVAAEPYASPSRATTSR